MADAAGKDTRVYISGYELTAKLTSATKGKSVDALDATVFGLNSRKFVAGMKSGSIELKGIMDFLADLGAADKLDAILGTAKVISVVHGNTAGGRGDGADVQNVDHGISEPADGLCVFSAKFKVQGELRYANILEPRATKNATGNGSARDDAASSSNGLVGILHADGITGTPGTIIVKIQSSPNGTDSWADEVTFTTIASNLATGEVKTSTGAVDRYLRAIWTLTGFTAVTLIVQAGRL